MWGGIWFQILRRGRWKWRTWKCRTCFRCLNRPTWNRFDLAVLPSNRLLLRFQECSRSKRKLKTIRLYSDDHCVLTSSASDSTFDYWRYINIWLTLTLSFIVAQVRRKKDARRVCRRIDIRRPLIAIISHKQRRSQESDLGGYKWVKETKHWKQPHKKIKVDWFGG